MKYFLIKAKEINVDPTKMDGMFRITTHPKNVIELTKEELEHLQYLNNYCACPTDNLTYLSIEITKKLRKVLN